MDVAIGSSIRSFFSGVEVDDELGQEPQAGTEPELGLDARRLPEIGVVAQAILGALGRLPDAPPSPPGRSSQHNPAPTPPYSLVHVSAPHCLPISPRPRRRRREPAMRRWD